MELGGSPSSRETSDAAWGRARRGWVPDRFRHHANLRQALHRKQFLLESHGAVPGNERLIQVQFNTAQRELTLKIVYYGPGLSGKTTNLRALYQRIQPSLRGHLMTLDTADDRTLFFDTLPLVFKSGNLKVKLKLFTVPGQVMHNSTRRIVLQGADAIAFVADSQPAKRQENYKYWLNMVENLKANGLTIESMPNVVQWNKKDLGDASTDEAIEKMRKENKQPVFEAVAVRGEGVVETFLGLVDLTFEQIDKHYLLSDKLGLDRRQFVEEVRRCLVDAPSMPVGAA